jgi:hypothetical protein
MIKVKEIGDFVNVQNPTNGEWTKMINVVFTEEGRAGANSAMAETNAFLNAVLGEQTGLSQVRTHTQPLLPHAAEKLKVGDELPGHINRELYSTPQLNQQQGVDARMVDGQPTYFVTKIEQEPKDDVDRRMDINIIAQHNPSAIFNARVGVANVKREKNPQSQGRPDSVDSTNTETKID